jgi:HK97 family phage major capsid protein
VTEARGFIDKDTPSAEDFASYEAAMKKVDELGRQADALDSQAALEATLSDAHRKTADERHISFDQAASDAARIVANEKLILRAVLAGNPRLLTTDEQRASYAEKMSGIQNAASTGTAAAGGATIAPEYQRELLIAMKAQGGMRAASRVLSTDTGVDLPWPTMDDRSQVATIVGENTQITADTDLSFGTKTLKGWTYKSGVLLVSRQLMQDSAFDFDGLVQNAIVGRFVRGTNADYTNGAGTAGPQGVTVGAALGVTGATGSTTSVTFDNVIDLIHSVDPVYRPGARFMFHDTTLQALRKLKDSNGRYLWQPWDQGASGAPPGDSIWGYPVTINQDMPVMAANALSIAFGNFQSYVIRDVLDMQMMVLRERYADYLQVGYLAFLRTDGRLVSAAQPIKTYKNSAT